MGFLLETLARDVKFAGRMLLKQPAFSLTVIGLLTLGIAGTTTIFSIFNGLYLRPLPFEQQERLVNMDEKAPEWNLERTGVAYPDFLVWRERNQAFEGMAVIQGGTVYISDENRADAVRAARATHDMTAVLKIQPLLGRWFLPEEDKPGARNVAVLGYGIWQSRFGGKSDGLQQTVRLNSQPYTIVGVMPASMDFPNRTELWIPLARDRNDDSGWNLNGIGRLKTGMTIGQAREDLLRVHKGMIETRNVNKITSPTVYTLREWYVGNFYDATSLLLGAVCLVLIIACTNIAGIVLARGSTRMREMGIRAAMGAPRTRIIRQLFTESLLLGALGGVLGTALGLLGLRALLSLMPANQLPGWVRFELDWRFLLFSLTISIGSAVLFGLWPAWNVSRADLRSALQDAGTRSSESAGRRRSLNALIALEVALAAVLLAAAGLLVQAFQKVGRVDPGFRADHVLTYQIGLPLAAYGKPAQRLAFIETLVANHRVLPGVRLAAAASATPLGGHWGNFFEVENAPARRPGDPNPVILKRVVTPGYLETMGMTLRSGRAFTDADGRSDGTGVVIVNETFAKLSWPSQDPIGKRIRQGRERPWWPVVGVIADVKDYGLDQQTRPSVFVPLAQEPIGSLSVVMRTSVADPLSLANAARDILRRMDPDLAMNRVTTMSQRLDESMWVRRMYSWLVVAFAGIAVVLVITGLYGVISYTVSQRRREIAIRMALGAGQKRILGAVVREALLLASIGLGIGVASGLWASQLLESLLFGVSRTDPGTYLLVSAILAGVAVVASLLPALRAARVEPISALRLD